MTAKNKNLLFTEVKQTERINGDISSFMEPFSDFVQKLTYLPDRDLKDYFTNADDLEKLVDALDILSNIQQSALNYGRNAATKLSKAA